MDANPGNPRDNYDVDRYPHLPEIPFYDPMGATSLIPRKWLNFWTLLMIFCCLAGCIWSVVAF